MATDRPERTERQARAPRALRLDPVALRIEIEGKGASVVCATCHHYWDAREKGVPGTGCTSRSGCGSPMAGDTFYDYDGPLTREHLAEHCFVCNHPGEYALVVVGRSHRVGVCELHLDLVVSREPLGPLHLIAELPDKVLVKRDDLLISLHDLRNKPRKKRFRDVFMEVEREMSGGLG